MTEMSKQIIVAYVIGFLVTTISLKLSEWSKKK